MAILENQRKQVKLCENLSRDFVAWKQTSTEIDPSSGNYAKKLICKYILLRLEENN